MDKKQEKQKNESQEGVAELDLKNFLIAAIAAAIFVLIMVYFF